MAARTPINYLAELGQARAHAIVMAKKNAHDRNNRPTTVIDPVLGCWLFQGSTNTDGYGQVSKLESSLLLTDRDNWADAL
jgi:hypothetical protein